MYLTFTVPGIPVPKGSLRHIGNGRLIEQTKNKPWMQAIRTASNLALIAEGWPRIEVPVRVEVDFYFPRPKAAKNRLYPHLRSVGDLDKLCRAVLDALQPNKTDDGIIADDSIVVDLIARKRYADDHPVGAQIWVRELL